MNKVAYPASGYFKPPDKHVTVTAGGVASITQEVCGTSCRGGSTRERTSSFWTSSFKALHTQHVHKKSLVIGHEVYDSDYDFLLVTNALYVRADKSVGFLILLTNSSL